MKKYILIVFVLLLMLSFCACGENQDSVKKDNKKESISWTDYNVGAVSNLTDAFFQDDEGNRIDGDNKPENVEIIVAPLCPYCKCDRWVDIINLDDLPIEELGNQTVLFETTTECLDWDKHWDTSEFNISILLTLNK